MGTLKPQNNGPFYSSMMIGTLAGDGYIWYILRRLGEAPDRPGPSSLYQM